MSFHSKITRTGGGRIKRALGVQAALEWAFHIEPVETSYTIARKGSKRVGELIITGGGECG